MINKTELKNLKDRYRVSDWNLVVETKFTFKPNKASWKGKTVTIYPFNFWSYLRVGRSAEKRNDEYLAKVLSHEFRHAQQNPPDNSLFSHLKDLRYLYWFHPLEKDARRWKDEHWKEFQGVITIAKKSNSI